MAKKIKIFLNYIYDRESKKLLSLPVVQCLYDYFKKCPELEVVEDIEDVDVFFFFAGGPPIFDEKHLKRISTLEKWGKWLPRFLAARYMLPNLTAERLVRDARRKNPNMKIIHRLDDRYLKICKLYGYEHTIANINQIADITVYQSRYCQKLYENPDDTIFGKPPRIEPENFRFIYNGVDESIFNADGEKLDLPGKIRICHVSATGMARKGLATVLTFAELLQNNPDIQFYLIGRQDLDILSWQNIRRLKNVTWLPYVEDRRELAKYMRTMSILLFPSIDDCSPNTVPEAMACGVPILAEKSGGVPELIEKDDGLLGGLYIDHANPIYNLKVLLENHATFSANAREIVRKYHTSTLMCEQYRLLVHELAGNNG